MELWRLLAHQHWFTIRFGGHKLRLCARCSGYIIGIFSILSVNYLITITIFNSLSIRYQIFFCLFLVVPLIYDWLTQSMKFREGSNQVRFITGWVAGIGVYLYQSISFTQSYKVIIFLVIVLTTLGIALFFKYRISHSSGY